MKALEAGGNRPRSGVGTQESAASVVADNALPGGGLRRVPIGPPSSDQDPNRVQQRKGPPGAAVLPCRPSLTPRGHVTGPSMRD